MILARLAKIINTFHTLCTPLLHGHLSSHNVFVSIPDNEQDLDTKIVVQIDGIELTDLKKYANKFSTYRNCNVWSAPEVLKQPKKVLDPTKQIDVYSFGILVWEVFHQHIPFDGKI